MEKLVQNLIDMGVPREQAVAYAYRLEHGEPQAKLHETKPITRQAADYVMGGMPMKDAVGLDDVAGTQSFQSASQAQPQSQAGISPMSSVGGGRRETQVRPAFGSGQEAEPSFNAPDSEQPTQEPQPWRPEEPRFQAPPRVSPLSYIENLMAQLRSARPSYGPPAFSHPR